MTARIISPSCVANPALCNLAESKANEQISERAGNYLGYEARSVFPAVAGLLTPADFFLYFDAFAGTRDFDFEVSRWIAFLKNHAGDEKALQVMKTFIRELHSYYQSLKNSRGVNWSTSDIAVRASVRFNQLLTENGYVEEKNAVLRILNILDRGPEALQRLYGVLRAAPATIQEAFAQLEAELGQKVGPALNAARPALAAARTEYARVSGSLASLNGIPGGGKLTIIAVAGLAALGAGAVYWWYRDDKSNAQKE